MADHPTPVQGEALPVVAKVKIEDGVWMNVYEPDFTMMADGMHSLTDHAQATAEIARLTAERDAFRDELDAALTEVSMEKSSALFALRLGVVVEEQRDELRTQLSTALAESWEMKRGWQAACAFIDSHVGDPDMTEEMCRTYAVFVDIRAALARHAATQESAE